MGLISFLLSMPSEADYSASFYATHSERYAQVAHEYLQSVYVMKSHPSLTGDLALQERLKELIPAGGKGLDAGCGAGARDVFKLYKEGYGMYGVDAIPENIQTALKWHPELKQRVSVHDLRECLPFENEEFDFLTCNAVIQHISPEKVHQVVLNELVRVLKPGGVMQLMFKNGSGVETLYDKDYDSNLTFQLFEEQEILKELTEKKMNLISAQDDKLGGVMTFVDPKNSSHCVMFLRKSS